MGLFDMFSKEGKLKRHARRMADRDAMPEDRDASARWLAEEGSRPSIAGLLTRFDMNLTQDMKDRAEKQLVFDLLTGLGEPVVEPLNVWVRRCKQYAWPLKLLVALRDEDEAVTAVFEILAGPVGKATFEPERRKELVVWLAERRHAGIVEHVAPFLKDFDEEVRYAAAETLVAQGDDSARQPLLAVLANPEEESLRLKHRLAQVFRQRGWSVEGELGEETVLPSGFQVREGRIVEAGR
ncbi:MAG: HEAT repeat domain-containing protein [Alphaproteobacteria bacterium]|nr:HEAT repeat domain-containing protein [Alphaproteobacteria bacterium]